MSRAADDAGTLRRAANDDRRVDRPDSADAAAPPGPHVLSGRDRLRGRLGARPASCSAGCICRTCKAALGPSGLDAPILAVLGRVFFAPIMFFYVLAHMVWRSQELRLIAQSMAEVAMRLAEPETVARESIVTVGQAIRREVAAMGDGVERALARAAELEALVANEVSALERAYNDNEVRIRGLLEDLAHQRDTLVGQAEQVRNAITGVHLDLSHDISSVSDLVAEQVNEASRRIAQALTEKGEHITLRARPRRRLHDRARSASAAATCSSGWSAPARRPAHAIAGASDRLTSSLNFKTDHITDEFAELTTNLRR